eukprot:TRINITY_DN13222_c0_g1_i2.p1 TRINITY_DN13222_c0_g1~~TRINITY_DN13222_c0_g1_i2.p1  ORF type:complete len:120 (+),score=31.60 TRINITY_DN13222_c0_g1_i2:202-561(+)
MQSSFFWWGDSREQRQEMIEHEQAKLVYTEDLLFFLRCQTSTHACTAAAFSAWKYSLRQADQASSSIQKSIEEDFILSLQKSSNLTSAVLAQDCDQVTRASDSLVNESRVDSGLFCILR